MKRENKKSISLTNSQTLEGIIPEVSDRRRRFYFKLGSVILIMIVVGGTYLYFLKKEKKLSFGRLPEAGFSLNDFPFISRLVEERADSGAKNIADEGAALKKKNEGTILEETSNMKKSKSENWWLNSGGLVYFNGKEFATNQGNISKNSRWYKLYANNNPGDTDGGLHPQNIFRLVTKSKWKNFAQSVYFYIEEINLSESKNRNASNGVLFFNHYQDGDNLYYVGLRVDGSAVIKKKIEGEYYLLAEKNIFKEREKYDRENHPNLIPVKRWIGLKSEIRNVGDEVIIKLYVDMEESSNWQFMLEAEDKEDRYGVEVIAKKGYAGIRSDFMDVIFRDYQVNNL